MTNAELIAALWLSNIPGETLTAIVDSLKALEAADAQVARFKRIVWHYRDAKVMADETAWPDDLLEAVRHYPHACQFGADAPECVKARATLRRYGLIADPSEGGTEHAD